MHISIKNSYVYVFSIFCSFQHACMYIIYYFLLIFVLDFYINQLSGIEVDKRLVLY